MDSISKAQKFQKQRVAAFFVYCFELLALSAVFLCPPVSLGSAGFGLDPSYQIGLLHALQSRLTFGTEYIFPYGPLAFVMTRLAPSNLTSAIWLSDICLLVALTQLFFTIALRSRSALAALILPCALIPICSDVYYYPAVFVWFGLMGFYLSEYLYFKRISALLLACAISLYVLYLKLNFGLISVPVIVGFLSFRIFFEQRKIFSLGILAGFAAALFLSAKVLNVDLVPYLRSGWHLADGFNDAMYVSPGPLGFLRPLHRGLLVVAAYGCLLLWKSPRIIRSRVALINTVFSSLFLYLLFKQAFVRADGHTLLFLQFAPFVIAPLVILNKNIFGKSGTALVALTILFSCLQFKERFSLEFISARLNSWSRYDNVFLTPVSDAAPIPAGSALPAELLAEIGQRSVDIFPWESSIPYFNHLQYDPRPIFQSYQAYDPYLDGLNAAFFRSFRAPEFILFSDYCVDDRYCFSDETQTKLVLLERYQVRDRSGQFLLLEKRAEDMPLRREIIAKGRVELGQKIKFDNRYGDQPLIISIDVKYSLFGSLQRILYQPPHVTLTLHLAGGSAKIYRGITPILRGGIVANQFVSGIDSAEKFFQGSWAALPKISSISINTEEPYGVKTSVRYRVEKLALGAAWR